MSTWFVFGKKGLDEKWSLAEYGEVHRVAVELVAEGYEVAAFSGDSKDTFRMKPSRTAPVADDE